MSGESDALLRLEFKVDLLIAGLQHAGLLLPSLPQMFEMGTPGDLCPVCTIPIKLTIQIREGSVIRTCGCTPPLVAIPQISLGEHHGKRTRSDSAEVPSETP